MTNDLNSKLIPYYRIAKKNASVENLEIYNEDLFSFYHKNDNCEVTINYNDASKSIIMYQEYDNGNMDDDEVSLLTFENYLSKKKMDDGGYMAKGGMIVAQKTFDINDNEVSEDIYEFLLDYISDDFELSEEDQFAIRGENPERVIDIMNEHLIDYEVISRYDDDQIRLKIIKKTKMKHGGKTQGYDDREDERLAMKYGKLSSKHLNSTHARRDDAEFEERMADGGYMADGGMMNDEKMTLKLKKEFEGKDLFDDEIVDEYVVKQFDYSEDDDKIEKFIRMKKNKFYVVPFDNQDDSYYYILVPKDKMTKGGKLKSNPAKFRDKVKAISKKLAGTKVPKKYKKDYGATYDKQEANTAARRISGAKLAELRAKLAKKTKSKKK